MTNFVLTVLDTVGIQPYIFGSNRLRENIGASFLVEQATSTWVADALPEPHNLSTTSQINTKLSLEDHPDQQAEVIYRGGGNVLILFRTIEQARTTVNTLTRKLLTAAPGLTLAVAHHSFTWESEPVGGHAGAFAQTMQKLAQRSQQRRASLELPGQSVTVTCRSSGLPAVTYDPTRLEELIPISAHTQAKLNKDVNQRANQRLRDFLPDTLRDTYALSTDFDYLGGTRGESNYLAVVHADGNAMGQRFRQVVHTYTDPGPTSRACLNALRALSQAVEQAGRNALTETVKHMTDAFLHDANFALFLAGLQTDADGKPYLPFRPLVFGGDDVTFVCDGRLGVSLAAAYLDAFDRAARDSFQAHAPALPAEVQQPADACAGVAIVKVGYPFVRAYQMCSDVCDSAKELRRTLPTSQQISALDWLYTTTGITESLDHLRHRVYTTSSGSLSMRPVTVSTNAPAPDGWRTWQTFTRLMDAFHQEPWHERRNKRAALREALRAGPDATRQFLVTYGLAGTGLPALPGADQQTQQTGWMGDRCGYFDAIELLDMYLPVTHGEEVSA